jgi:N-formylglutamate amidohydrolase
MDKEPDKKEPEKKEPEKLVTIHKGKLPIILSAPHGGKLPIEGVPERKGEGVTQFVIVNDTNSDKLALKFSEALKKEMGGEPYLVVANFARKYCDANRPAKGSYEHDTAKPVYDEYHKALKDACDEVRKTWGHGLLIDLHGQAAEADTIFRGTNKGNTVKDMQTRFGKKSITGPNSLLGIIAKKGYKVFPEVDSDEAENPKFGGGYIVQTYGSSNGTGIDAIQFETGGNHRSTKNLDRTAKDFAEAVKEFAKNHLPKEKVK